MENELKWHEVTYWLRQNDKSIIWCWHSEGVIGPDNELHVILEPADFVAFVDFVNDLAEGIKEMDNDNEPPQREDQAGEE